MIIVRVKGKYRVVKLVTTAGYSFRCPSGDLWTLPARTTQT
jgi:hypothetical protein